MDELAPILDLAATQHGVLGRHQVRQWLEPKRADDLLRTVHFTRMLHGVYRLRGAPELAEQDAFAAVLRARPGATLTGPMALRLYGVAGFEEVTQFLVLTPTWRRLSNVPFDHQLDQVRRRGVRTFGDIRVAGPLDALIDAAGFGTGIEDRQLRIAWDHLRGKGLTTPARLERRIEQLRNVVEGAAILERVLEVGGGARVESEGERRLAPVMGCFEPALEAQVWVTPRRRTDFFSHRCRYGFEYVGKVDHAYIAQRIADDERDTELRRDGIRLGYISARDLDDPTALVATIAGSLTVRAHELGVAPPVAVRPLPPHLRP